MVFARLVFTGLLAAAGSFGAHAQQQATTSPMPSMPESAAIAPDCMKGAMARHDHGMEKGSGPMDMKPCAPATSATELAASNAATQAKKGHDHAKFHKNQ